MTGDCPTSFGVKQASQLKALYESSSWTYSIPNVTIVIVFDQDMDTSVLPNFLSFEAKSGGTPKVVSIVDWLGFRSLRMTFAEGASPPASVTIELLNQDANLRNANLQLVDPFGPFTVTPP